MCSQLVCPEDKAWNWREIVRYYSKTHLTHSADKLPALSGVARRQHEATGDEYLAGMWRKGLMRQLGWMPRSKNKRPDWRAPTWSWASIDAETLFWSVWYDDSFAKNEYVQVLDARVTLAGPDPFVAVSGGELQLGCTAMVRAIVRGRYCEPVKAEDADGAESGEPENSRVMLVRETPKFPITMDCLEDKFMKADNPIYLLPLFGGIVGRRRDIRKSEHTKDKDEDKSNKKWVADLMVRGIILQHSGPIKGYFRRIGCSDFRDGLSVLDDAESKKDHYYEFLQVIKEVSASTVESKCARIISDAEHPESRYVITIV